MLKFEQLESRILLAGLTNCMDVNNDGEVSPVDVGIVINYLESGQDTDIHMDVNGDNKVSPVDALIIINHINVNAVDNVFAELRQFIPIEGSDFKWWKTELITSENTIEDIESNGWCVVPRGKEGAGLPEFNGGKAVLFPDHTCPPLLIDLLEVDLL